MNQAHSTHSAPPARHVAGFTLVELMVAMAVSLFLTAGILQLFSGTRQSYRATEALSRVQENGRFGIEYIGRDLRQAGFHGTCIETVSLNSLLDEADDEYTDERFDLSEAVHGWDGGTDPTVFDKKSLTVEDHHTYEPNTDVFIVKHSSKDAGVELSAAIASNSASLPVSGDTDPLVNAILVISSPMNCDLFQNTASTGSTALERAEGGTPGPGNLDPSGETLSSGYEEDATRIYRFHSHLYFIAQGENEPVPGLWVRQFDEGFNPSPTDEDYEDKELISGIADMQVQYGMDTNGDDVLDEYVDAEDIDSDEWDQVLAVRVSLLATSEDDFVTPAAMTLPFHDNSGTTFQAAANDRHLYQTFTATVGLRNNLP